MKKSTTSCLGCDTCTSVVPLSFIDFHSIYSLFPPCVPHNCQKHRLFLQTRASDSESELAPAQCGNSARDGGVQLGLVSWVAGMSRIQMKLFLFSRHRTAHLQQSSNERRACNAMVYRTWPDTTATVMVRPLPRTLIENILCNPSTVGVMCDYWHDERHLLRT